MEINNRSRLVGMLGFAMRAGKVIIGTDAVCSSLSKKGKAKPRVVLISESASEGAKNKVTHKCEFYGVTVFSINITSSELGSLLGKLYAPVTVAVCDERFADEIVKAVCPDEDGGRDTVQ